MMKPADGLERSSKEIPWVVWIILAILSCLYLLENFDRYLIGVSLIPYINYSSYEYSILAGPIFTVIYACGGLFFALSHFEDTRVQFSQKAKYIMLYISTIVFSICFGLSAVCYNFTQLVLVRLGMGLAQSVVTPFSASIIRDIFPPNWSGTAFSIFNTGTYVAFSMSLSLGVWIYDSHGWRAGYVLFGLIGIALSFAVPLAGYLAKRNSLPLYVNLMAHAAQTESIAYNPLTAVDEVADNNSITSPLSSSSPSRSSRSQHSISIYDEEKNNLNSTHSLVSLESLDTVHDARPSSTTSQPRNSNDNGAYHHFSFKQLYRQWKHRLYQILCVHWWRHPAIYICCLATGVRLGGGYIWSAYTAIFYGELFIKQEDSHSCQYSYSTVATLSGMCSSDYPYCVDHTCSAVAQYPWHNQGMSSLHIEEYMSWIPLVGSCLGNLLGGLIADRFVHAKQLYSHEEKIHDDPTGKQLTINRSALRSLLSGISAWAALPLVCMSFYLPFPGCFLIYIGSGILGEVYLSQMLALITEEIFIPAELITPSVALFLLVTTAIGGNATVLVPWMQTFSTHNKVTITFSAASTSVSGEMSEYSVEQTSAAQLQQALVYSLILCYGLSGLLYIIAYRVMTKR